ncbi:flagellar filament capping protein FliD [Eubacterium oxidoreducens]|uniref:Flagellar hook-associated protein 2 n=1 Tax=Eubacterium oxidoreducens TaxID=1732 RepID=A0A1G6BSN8_EUBOX|nr:flagellar filament capping protein FliD [Eubacterium oxidoreducens]SDB23596.1 flagellar hook-associated protein 2 [Eubacterium oxidoreducens]
MAAIDSVFNYYVSNYGHTNNSRYDTHKKSELRNVWNNIVKVNKESPLFKLKDEDSESIQKFVIDVKESARSINNVIASLTTEDGDIQDAFQKKIASSTNPDLVSAEYIGDNADLDDSDDFTISVQQLAKSQVNIGNFLPKEQSSIEEGDYSFNLNYLNNQYEFQFHVNDNETNLSIQNRLGTLISNAKIGLNASLLDNNKGGAALKIESTQTGLSENERYLFDINANANTNAVSLLDTLGIDHVAQNAQNSRFELNGVERSSYSNTFTINKTFEVTLNGISPDDDDTTIGFKPNVDAIADNIQELIDSYNHAIQTAYDKSTSPTATKRLINDISSTTYSIQNEMESVGLTTAHDGTIHVDKGLLSQAIDNETSQEELFDVLSKFKDALSAKAQAVSLNPMKYVDKVVVEYKNPGHNFATPYISSIYSGMMIDRFC